MATELGPTPVKEPASGGAPIHHGPKGVGEDNAIASQGKWASWLLAPTIVALAIVIVYPIISAIVMSFQKDAGLDPVTGLFTEGGPAGFSNYTNWIFQQCAAPGGGTVACPPGTLGAQFWSATGTTFYFTIVTVTLETILGFWMAIIMARHLPGPQPGPRGRAGAVGHPHRRHGPAVAVHLRLRGHRQQAVQHHHPVDGQRNRRPGGRSSSPTPGKRRRSWRC